MVRRTVLAVLAALAALCLVAVWTSPAGAVPYAPRDTAGRHPLVGTLVLQSGLPGSYRYHSWCSGALLSRQGGRAGVAVAMVARGHCFDRSFRRAFHPGSTMLGVTIQSRVPVVGGPPDNSVHDGTAFVLAGSTRAGRDVGVYVFSQPFAVGAPLPRLPRRSDLDRIRADGHRLDRPAVLALVHDHVG